MRYYQKRAADGHGVFDERNGQILSANSFRRTRADCVAAQRSGDCSHYTRQEAAWQRLVGRPQCSAGQFLYTVPGIAKMQWMPAILRAETRQGFAELRLEFACLFREHIARMAQRIRQ